MLVKLIDGVLKGLLTKDGTWEPVTFHDVHFNPEEGVEYIVNGVVPISTVAGPLVMGTDPEKPWEVTVLFDNQEKGSWEQVAVMGKVIAVDTTQQKLLPSREDAESISRTSPYHLKDRRMTPLDLSSLSPEEIQIAWQENKKMEMAHSINCYLKRFGVTNNLTEEQIQGIFDRMQAPCVLNTQDVAGAYLVANALLTKDPLSVEKPAPTLCQIFNGLQHKTHKLARLSFLYKCFREEFRLPQSAGMEDLKAAIREKHPDVADFLIQSMDKIQLVVEGAEMSQFGLELLLTHMTTLAGAVIPQKKRAF